MPKRRLLCCLLLALTLAQGAHAEEGDRALVRAVMKRVAKSEDMDDFAPLWRLGWERVHPHIDLTPPVPWWAVLEVASRMGKGPPLYRLALAAIRTGNEAQVVGAIQLLMDAVDGDGMRPDSLRTKFDPAWWRDLLLELHKTRVVVIDTFYSGPGWPSSNLARFLADRVHGTETQLAALAADPDWRVRMLSLPFLAATRRARTPAVHAVLVGALRDPHPKVRESALGALAEGRWHGLLKPFGERLLNVAEVESVRQRAASELIDLEGLPASAAVPYLLKGVRDKKPGVRAACADTLDYVSLAPPVATALLGALEDPDAQVRAAADGALAVGDWRPLQPGVSIEVAKLRARLTDPEAVVRRAAARVLAARRQVPSTFVPTLIKWVKGTDVHDVVAGCLALASLRHAAAEALPALKPLTYKTDGRLRFFAADAVEAIEMAALADDAVRALRDADDPESRVRAVRENHRRGRGDVVSQALRSPVKAVAREAAWLLRLEPARTADVVAALIRTGPRSPDEREFRVLPTFHALGARLRPHVPQLIDMYRSQPEAPWFDTLAVVEEVMPALADAVWEQFAAGRLDVPLERIAALRAQLGPRLLTHFLSSTGSARTNAFEVIQALQADHRHFSDAELRRLFPILGDKDPLRDRLQALIEAHEQQPHWTNTDLR